MSENVKHSTQNKNGGPNDSKKKPKKKGIIGVLKYLFIFLLIGGIIACGAVYFYVSSVVKDLPPINPSSINADLAENSIIVDSEDHVLATLSLNETRTVIAYDDINKDVINAFVAVEDKTFWEHNGLNYVRLFGAVWDSITTGDRIGGTSTITQQLARNVYLFDIRSERSIDRKVQEIYYAFQLENMMTKKQIMEAYLNKISLGFGTNGIEAASQAYFSKSAKDLNKVEAAILAGIPSSPSYYSPMLRIGKEEVTEDHVILDESDPKLTTVYNEVAESRYLTVIYMMHANGYITDAEYEEMKNVYLPDYLNPGQTVENEITTYFSDMVFNDVVEDLMVEYSVSKETAANMIYTQGYTIHSTIDFDMQKTLESAYSLNSFTNYYGENTAAAIRSFQNDYGLSVDGSAGRMTLSKLAEIGAINLDEFPQEFYGKGMEAEEILTLNQALYDLGYLISNSNVPKVSATFDAYGNIIASESKKILLYDKKDFVNENNQLIIPSSDFEIDADGNLTLYKNRRFYFYPKYSDGDLTNIQIVVKPTYDIQDGSSYANGTYDVAGLYSYEGRDLYVFDPNVKSFDDNGNVVISKDFMMENPGFFSGDDNGNLLVDSSNYYISDQGIIQPQSSMVIIDYHTGQLKAIVGGRNISGQKIFNRATSPRQPGSAIKPLAVYTPAIDTKKYTATSIIDDIPVYLKNENPEERWPLNWYEDRAFKYKGQVTLRKGLEWSINVVASLVAQDVGIETSIDYLKRFGITSIVDSGPINDHNLSATSLGGMAQGISPVEMTAAYGALANGGVYTETITYTTVTDHNGEVVLENEQMKNYVVSEQTAYVVEDMMKTGVDRGVAAGARIDTYNSVIPVAGKTGTTSDKIDVWFVGYTPYYVGGIWFGNDVNIPLDQSSDISASFWSNVMQDIHADLEPKGFDVPEGIVRQVVDTSTGLLPSPLSAEDPRNPVKSEVFIQGTEPTKRDDRHEKALVCTESGQLATNLCPESLIEERVFVKREVEYVPEDHLDKYGNPIYPEDWEYELPTKTCEVHDTVTIDESIDYSQLTDIDPYTVLPNGERIVLKPFYITLISDQQVMIPIQSIIKTDDTIVYPDDSKIPGNMVKYIPDFRYDDYDDYYQFQSPVVTDLNDDSDNESTTTDGTTTNTNSNRRRRND